MAYQFRRIFRPPWDIPGNLAGNAALMCAAWFLLPPRAHDWMFNLHGPLAFPVVLASWMMADTPATNVLGSDPALAISVVKNQTAYWRWLSARCIVLGTVVGVPCAVVAFFIGIRGYRWSEVVGACAVIALLPLAVLPIAAWLGIVFPYRPRSLRWRWEHRRNWRVNLRWALLVFAPFLFVPVVGVAILAPSVVLSHWTLAGPPRRLTAAEFDLAAAVACVTAVVVCGLGIWGARRLLAIRADKLAAYLANPDAG